MSEPSKPTSRSLPCPSCNRAMEVQTMDGISIDVCPQHGIWLDLGDLERFVDRLSLKQARRAERIVRDRVQEAEREGKISGVLLGLWSLLA